jgi:MtfA peptidase
MELLLNLAGIFFALAMFIAILGLIFQTVKGALWYFFDYELDPVLFFTRLRQDYREILKRDFPYYKNLSARNKKVFERRVQKFINMKEFIPRGDLSEITSQMEVLIAASAIQITFGLPSVYLTQFKNIIVYPEVFYSTSSAAYHRGEVNTHGFIVLSWKNFVEGYANNTDGRNLALHEMAHALKTADAMGGDESGFFDPDSFHKFIHHARLTMQKIAKGEDSFFRSYAATNDQEFFAVAVENFFERPALFSQRHPALFDSLVDLLNQNPLILNKGL